MEWIRKSLAMSVCLLMLFAITACSDDGESPYKDEYEPNNKITNPTDITLGTTYNASISKGDRDFFRFSIDNDEIIETFEIELGNFSEDIELETYIYDNLGRFRWGGYASPGYGYEVYYHAIEGNIIVEIGDKNDDAKGDYTLTVSDLNDGDDNEPNDGFPNATDIHTYPTEPISANITAPSDDIYEQDWDYYKVTVMANKKVEATITPETSNLTIHYKTYDKYFSVYDEGSTGDPGGSVLFSINNPTGENDIFYVKVGGLLNSRFLYGINYTISFIETDAEIK